MTVLKFLRYGIASLPVCGLLAGCMVVRKPTPGELHALDAPPGHVAGRVDQLLPRAASWHRAAEERYLSQGRALSAEEIATARRMGVLHADRVRIAVLEEFPMPEEPDLLAYARKLGVGGSLEGGRAMGYAVLLKPVYRDHATVLAHELVHVTQYERMGREGFLRRYLIELEMLGYARAPLELEAYEKQGR